MMGSYQLTTLMLQKMTEEKKGMGRQTRGSMEVWELRYGRLKIWQQQHQHPTPTTLVSEWLSLSVDGEKQLAPHVIYIDNNMIEDLSSGKCKMISESPLCGKSKRG